jgi:S1-C subfamily serine protease
MAGTGFLVDGAGNAVTSLHVVAGCGLVTVAGVDRVRIAARVVAVAHESDLALLATDRAAPAAVATLSPRPGRPADTRAMAVGHSLLGQPSASATAVDAIVPPGAAATAQWRFAFRGKPYPGHSGSPLLDSFGEVIGVVHARAPEPGSGPEGRNDPRIGLAVSLAALQARMHAWWAPSSHEIDQSLRAMQAPQPPPSAPRRQDRHPRLRVERARRDPRRRCGARRRQQVDRASRSVEALHAARSVR